MHTLQTLIEAAKAEGLTVYVPKTTTHPSGRTTYAYITDGTAIAYVQEERRDGPLTVSTVNVPHKNTGTGFGFHDEREGGRVTVDTIRRAMACTAPHWAKPQDRAAVRKWASWEAFAAHPHNTIIGYKQA